MPSGDERTDSIIHLACDTIVEACRNAPNTSTSTTAHQSQPPTLKEACIAAKQIWSMLLPKFCCVTVSCEQAEGQHLAAYSAICTVIETLLGCLHQYCLDEADRQLKMTRKTKKARNSRARAAQQGDSRKAELFEHNCGLVADILAHMLATAGTLQQNSQQLFEAITSVFLEHLGSAMSLHMFASDEASNAGSLLAPPRGIQDVSHIETRDALLTTQVEAPYLIRILKGLMRSEVSNHGTKEESQVPEYSQPATIKTEVLHKLQKQLIRGIFDEDLVSPAEDTAKSDSPVVTGSQSPQAVSDEDSHDRDWFLSQVWDLIGWDILLEGPDELALSGNRAA